MKLMHAADLHADSPMTGLVNCEGRSGRTLAGRQVTAQMRIGANSQT